MSLRLPRERDRRECPHVAFTTRAGRHLEVQRDTIHTVVETFAPDEIAARGELQPFDERAINTGLQVHDVLRADERGLVEVSAAWKERVERAEVRTAVVAARNVGAEENTRIRRRIGERPTRVGCRRPRQNVGVAERTELADEFKVPVERAVFAEQSCAERMARFIRRAPGELCILPREAEVIEIRAQAGNELNRPSEVAAPARRAADSLVVEDAGVNSHRLANPPGGLPSPEAREHSHGIEWEPFVG